ncbi:hypothetical protein WN51_07188 [Melipona quadrifasciata]|uniref:Uncharacterized protein n=1 Tax=Melipona quadrifasciata TaxID=166423 RepID=A0A0M9A9F0_9HYME|nr:hypothetical protein WN51_07188 [Melipona quadrifasciata]
MSTTPSYCIRSNTMLSVMKTPVLPTPALQCTGRFAEMNRDESTLILDSFLNSSSIPELQERRRMFRYTVIRPSCELQLFYFTSFRVARSRYLECSDAIGSQLLNIGDGYSHQTFIILANNLSENASIRMLDTSSSADSPLLLFLARTDCEIGNARFAQLIGLPISPLGYWFCRRTTDESEGSRREEACVREESILTLSDLKNVSLEYNIIRIYWLVAVTSGDNDNNERGYVGKKMSCHLHESNRASTADSMEKKMVPDMDDDLGKTNAFRFDQDRKQTENMFTPGNTLQNYDRIIEQRRTGVIPRFTACETDDTLYKLDLNALRAACETDEKERVAGSLLTCRKDGFLQSKAALFSVFSRKLANIDRIHSPVSRTVYRGLVVSMGSMSRTQEMIGGGEPTAVQSSTALCPISTTLVVGACDINGNPFGNFSAVTIRAVAQFVANRLNFPLVVLKNTQVYRNTQSGFHCSSRSLFRYYTIIHRIVQYQMYNDRQIIKRELFELLARFNDDVSPQKGQSSARGQFPCLRYEISPPKSFCFITESDFSDVLLPLPNGEINQQQVEQVDPTVPGMTSKSNSKTLMTVLQDVLKAIVDQHAVRSVSIRQRHSSSTPLHESHDPNQPIANFRCISVAEEARFSGLPPLKSLSVIKFYWLGSCFLEIQDTRLGFKKNLSTPQLLDYYTRKVQWRMNVLKILSARAHIDGSVDRRMDNKEQQRPDVGHEHTLVHSTENPTSRDRQKPSGWIREPSERLKIKDSRIQGTCETEVQDEGSTNVERRRTDDEEYDDDDDDDDDGRETRALANYSRLNRLTLREAQDGELKEDVARKNSLHGPPSHGHNRINFLGGETDSRLVQPAARNKPFPYKALFGSFHWLSVFRTTLRTPGACSSYTLQQFSSLPLALPGGGGGGPSLFSQAHSLLLFLFSAVAVTAKQFSSICRKTALGVSPAKPRNQETKKPRNQETKFQVPSSIGLVVKFFYERRENQKFNSKHKKNYPNLANSKSAKEVVLRAKIMPISRRQAQMRLEVVARQNPGASAVLLVFQVIEKFCGANVLKTGGRVSWKPGAITGCNGFSEKSNSQTARSCSTDKRKEKIPSTFQCIFWTVISRFGHTKPAGVLIFMDRCILKFTCTSICTHINSHCDRPIGIESSSREAQVDENGAREEEQEEKEGGWGGEERFQLSTPATVVVGSSVPRMITRSHAYIAAGPIIESDYSPLFRYKFLERGNEKVEETRLESGIDATRGEETTKDRADPKPYKRRFGEIAAGGSNSRGYLEWFQRHADPTRRRSNSSSHVLHVLHHCIVQSSSTKRQTLGIRVTHWAIVRPPTFQLRENADAVSLSRSLRRKRRTKDYKTCFEEARSAAWVSECRAGSSLMNEWGLCKKRKR